MIAVSLHLQARIQIKIVCLEIISQIFFLALLHHCSVRQVGVLLSVSQKGVPRKMTRLAIR